MMNHTGSQAIKRKSLHQELVDRLQPLIIGGELAPGSKVPEKTLCTRFGVSRTPLREALKVLASEGLVRLEPNRGRGSRRSRSARSKRFSRCSARLRRCQANWPARA